MYKEKFDDYDDLARKVSEVISNNKIVGFFQGKSEFGPRALGCRSILANPTWSDVKDHLNENVKNREWWRPYAPIAMQEYAHRYFDFFDSPYMMFSSKVRDKNIPGITHEDNSARVQTVSREQNKRIWKVLNEFHKLTGYALLLNTSFNVGGEPIVESPKDAVNTFLNSNIDCLCIGDWFIEK